MMSKTYIGWWDTEAEMIHDFRISKGDLDGVEVLLAIYTGGGYDGSAYVIFKKDNKYYTVSGSHCSCNGLEYQWEPVETTLEALKLISLEHYATSAWYDLNQDEKDNAIERWNEIINV